MIEHISPPFARQAETMIRTMLLLQERYPDQSSTIQIPLSALIAITVSRTRYRAKLVVQKLQDL